MGLLDRLFGRKKNNVVDAEKKTPSSETPPPQPQPASSPAAEEEKKSPLQDASEYSDDASPSETDITDTEIILEEPDSQPFDSSPSSVSAPPLLQRTWDDVTQRKLDRYFNRLRELYPDGVITRLNTGHKKLAERGAQLRSLLGMEGELDNFFALGGFSYCRTGGGRPPLPLTDADCERIHAHIRQLFPEGVPVVMAIRDADHRLYLDLRAVARREGKKLADYLRENGLMSPKNPPVNGTEVSSEE